MQQRSQQSGEFFENPDGLMDPSLTMSLRPNYDLETPKARPSSKLFSGSVYTINNLTSMRNDGSSLHRTELPGSRVTAGFVNSSGSSDKMNDGNLSSSSIVLSSICFFHFTFFIPYLEHKE